MATRPSAAQVLEAVIDAASWQSWDVPADQGPVSDDYAADLRRAEAATGVDESVITGSGVVGGVRVALVVSEFGFLGGSIGRVAGERVVRAIRRATEQRLAVLALPASGGTRMQEGTSAFLQMVGITGAVKSHRDAGLPYLVYLRHPTTGGVFASWGSMGHITWAEPGALIGFLGPRVYEGLSGNPFPEGVQRAENLVARGLFDAVVPLSDLAALTGRVVELLMAPPDDAVSLVVDDPVAHSSLSAWEVVLATRDPARPGLRELLTAQASVVIGRQGPIWLALSRIGGHPVVVIGQDRYTQRHGQLIGPADLRVARRGLTLARELQRPVVTVIDTPGAELSATAEEAGLAREIARCLADLIDVPTPSVSVLLGEGAGGAALALFPADVRIATPDAWLSPLPPEGASVIVYRDTEHAAELVARQRIRAVDLLSDGQVDGLAAWADGSGPGPMRRAIAGALDGLVPSRDRRIRSSLESGQT
ncbi:carboxyl transferase domain-containing protein [Gordonia sp. NPDC003425]